MRNQRLACEFWPEGKVEPAFYEPVTSNMPTLVLSGELDPVTPPVWGEQIAKHAAGVEAHRHSGDRSHRRRHRVRHAHHPQLHRQGHAPTGSTRAASRGASPAVLRVARGAGPDVHACQAARRGRLHMIRVENLHKRFGDVHAVDGVSFTAARRRGDGPARPERRRQDDDAAHALRADAAGRGPHPRGRRRRGGRSAKARAAARRAARSVGAVSAPDRARAHSVLRRAAGHHRTRPARRARRTC